MSATYQEVRPALLAQLATLERGWASMVQASFEVAPDDAGRRSYVRRLLHELVRDEVIDRMVIRHRDEGMSVVYLDPEAIRSQLDKVNSQ